LDIASIGIWGGESFTVGAQPRDAVMDLNRLVDALALGLRLLADGSPAA
jgi:hypothetical protein